MATAAGPRPLATDDGFFFKTAIAMAAVLAAGFSVNLWAGRSSFSLPLIFHLHAFVFFGWTALYVTQTLLVGRGSLALHRRLGWLAALWIPAMVVLGFTITLHSLRTTGGPFFFDQPTFLIGNPVGVLTFAGLAVAAIRLRRRTDWHRRLMFCAMAGLTGPGFGRLLPLPFMIPWSWFAASLVMPMVFPLIGILADKRRTGSVHPAWWWGAGILAGSFCLGQAIAYSPLGVALTRAVVDGTPGAARPMQAFLPPGFG